MEVAKDNDDKAKTLPKPRNRSPAKLIQRLWNSARSPERKEAKNKTKEGKQTKEDSKDTTSKSTTRQSRWSTTNGAPKSQTTSETAKPAKIPSKSPTKPITGASTIPRKASTISSTSIRDDSTTSIYENSTSKPEASSISTSNSLPGRRRLSISSTTVKSTKRGITTEGTSNGPSGKSTTITLKMRDESEKEPKRDKQ